MTNFVRTGNSAGPANMTSTIGVRHLPRVQMPDVAPEPTRLGTRLGVLRWPVKRKSSKQGSWIPCAKKDLVLSMS